MGSVGWSCSWIHRLLSCSLLLQKFMSISMQRKSFISRISADVIGL
ncbi:hypothetical protein LINPERHAP1_LOCUS41129 [Linum perenne]